MAAKTYDYIIVGAGSAGCVLADRLSKDPSCRVLLLESGQRDRSKEIHIPAAFSKLFKTSFDWAYSTEPEPHLDNRQLYIPRGRTLGGSSSMNAMIYIRGNRADYDGWRDSGCQGWSYSEVLPYFKRAEHQERGASEYHGTTGPLNVADLRCVNPLSQAFVDAGVETGLQRNEDFNGSEQEGVGIYQVTQKNGSRHSTADAYLRPALKRPNLEVRTGALASRIFFEGERAAGVEFVQRGRPLRLRADREVLLCGGSINSPQLLLLSGIGPAEELRRHGIGVVADLPGVGGNLQDHPVVAVMYHATKPVSLASAESFGSIARYLLFKNGMLTSNVAEAGGFVRMESSSRPPDLQFHFAPGFFQEHGFVKPEGHGFTIGPTLIAPQSRGRIRLRSSDPTQPPRIEGNFLAHDGDLRVLLDGIRLSREIAHAPALREFCGAEVLPGTDVVNEDAVTAYVRRTAEMLYHPVGTCQMGIGPMAVVDPRLRVHGLTGLRVIDASVMPSITRGNTNAPTIMIAEKAADLITAT